MNEEDSPVRQLSMSQPISGLGGDDEVNDQYSDATISLDGTPAGGEKVDEPQQIFFNRLRVGNRPR